MASKSLQRKRARIESPHGRGMSQANMLGGGKNLRKTSGKRSQRRQRIKRQKLANRRQS